MSDLVQRHTRLGQGGEELDGAVVLVAAPAAKRQGQVCVIWHGGCGVCPRGPVVVVEGGWVGWRIEERGFIGHGGPPQAEELLSLTYGAV